MPAIAPPQAQVVVVWNMPFVKSTSRDPKLQGPSAKQTAREAEQALRRFRSTLFDEMGATTVPQTCVLNPHTAMHDIRAFAAEQGLDFDELVDGAAIHFTAPAVARRTEPLSTDELESLFDDDQNTFAR